MTYNHKNIVAREELYKEMSREYDDRYDYPGNKRTRGPKHRHLRRFTNINRDIVEAADKRNHPNWDEAPDF